MYQNDVNGILDFHKSPKHAVYELIKKDYDSEVKREVPELMIMIASKSNRLLKVWQVFRMKYNCW